MISSRWPRPIGTRASIAFRPVCIGSVTDLRGMMPGALSSTRRRSVEAIGPLPSIGLPRPSTTRPSKPLPTGTSTMVPVRLTVSPSLMPRSSPKITTPTLSVSRLRAMPLTPPGNSTISPALTLSRPVDARDTVADRQHLANLGDFRLDAKAFDLLLDDGRNFGGPDIHHATPFIASCKRCSLVRIDESNIREPTLTTSPPRRSPSTRAFTETLLPTRRRSVSFSAFN